MTDYALTTWAAHRLIGYESIVAKSALEATAFAQGMLTERVRHHGQDLITSNLRYDLEHGSRELHEVTNDHVAVVVGSWTLGGVDRDIALFWSPGVSQTTTYPVA